MQQQVQLVQGAAIPGEFFNNSPRVVTPYTIISALASYNIFGGAGFSVIGQAQAAAGNSGSAPFAGILVNPKEAVSYGNGSSALAPVFTLPNNEIGQLCTEGNIFVTLPASCNIGDLLIYDNTTGALSTITPSTVLPSGKSPAYGIVKYFLPNASGTQIALVQINLSVPYKLS